MPKKRLLFLIVLISLFSLSCNIFNLIMDRVADDEEVDITEQEIVEPLSTPTEKAAEEEPVPEPEEDFPPQSSQPVLWSLLQKNHFISETMLSGVWWDIDSFPVSYEFLTYNSIPGMLLKVAGPFLALYPNMDDVRYNLRDVELETFLAIPEPVIGVALVCRQQTTAGENYTFLINQDQWWITKNSGGQAYILSEGSTSSVFNQGKWEMFRFRCEGNRLTAWDSRGVLGDAADSTFSSGAAGTFFLNDQSYGVGQVYLFQSSAYVKDPSRDVGLVLDTFQSGDIFVNYGFSWQFHGQVSEGGIQGVVMNLDVNIENRGDTPIVVEHDDITLQRGDRRVAALAQAPEAVDADYPAVFPLTILPGNVEGGQVFFVNITESDLMEGWELVIDLRDQGLGVMRFAVPVQ